MRICECEKEMVQRKTDRSRKQLERKIESFPAFDDSFASSLFVYLCQVAMSSCMVKPKHFIFIGKAEKVIGLKLLRLCAYTQ